MESIIDWLEGHQLSCFYRHYFGIDCPGCGMQTAIILLLRGEVWESIRTYPPLFPILFLVAFLILHLRFRFKKGASVLKICFIFTVAIMVINYALKFVTV